MNAKKLLLLTILMLAASQSIYVSLCEPPNRLISAWSINPVTIDGDITNPKEWIDANSIELIIGTNYGRSPPFLETKIWAKNDMTHLYLLYRIQFPYNEYDLADLAFIYYLIPATPSGYIITDKSIVGQLTTPQDLFNYTGTTWQNDVPGGENNVEGMGHYDGTFYWFEIKKPLNSQDSRDWLFELGETYGYATSPIHTTDHLCIGMFDESKRYAIQNFIQLVIAKPAINEDITVGGELAPTLRKQILLNLVQTAIIYLATITCSIIAIKKLL